jgi:hypothetical protein
MSGFNSNLASEFHVLSCLHRLGADASLTLGNKESVDIHVITDAGVALSIDVKASASRADWPFGNNPPAPRFPDRHYLVLVGYDNKIRDLMAIPRVWIFPYSELPPFLRTFKNNMVCASWPLVRENGSKYENAWQPFIPFREPE